MATHVRQRFGSRPEYAVRHSLWSLASLVSLATAAVVGLIVIAIALIVLEANRSNDIVDWLVGAGEFLAGPFDNVFSVEGRKAEVAVNWGLAAIVYGLAGGLIARLLRR